MNSAGRAVVIHDRTIAKSNRASHPRCAPVSVDRHKGSTPIGAGGTSSFLLKSRAYRV